MKNKFDRIAHVQAHKDRIAQIKKDIKEHKIVQKEKDKKKQRREDERNDG